MKSKYVIIYNVINGSRILVKNKPFRVWTLLNENHFKQFGPIHLKNAFLEDRFHDWDWKSNVLHFYGHSGNPGEKHNLILEYKEYTK